MRKSLLMGLLLLSGCYAEMPTSSADDVELIFDTLGYQEQRLVELEYRYCVMHRIISAQHGEPIPGICVMKQLGK